MADAATRGMPLGEHISSTLGYLLRTCSIPWYSQSTGSQITAKLSDVLPGCIIRPAQRTFSDRPMIDLRDSETVSPYCTWMRRSSHGTGSHYGGGEEIGGLFEIDIFMGSKKPSGEQFKSYDYDHVVDWLQGFLQANETYPVYFFRYDSTATPPVSRGDQVAWGRIHDVTIADRAEVAEARNIEGWVVATFGLTVLTDAPGGSGK